MYNFEISLLYIFFISRTKRLAKPYLTYLTHQMTYLRQLFMNSVVRSNVSGERSPFDGSCCGSGYHSVGSESFDSMNEIEVPKYRVVTLGDAGVGKTALVSQFMTSEYMNTYDASLGKPKGKLLHFFLLCPFVVFEVVNPYSLMCIILHQINEKKNLKLLFLYLQMTSLVKEPCRYCWTDKNLRWFLLIIQPRKCL